MNLTPELMRDIEGDAERAIEAYEEELRYGDALERLREALAEGSYQDYMEAARDLRRLVDGIIDAVHPEEWDGEDEAEADGPVVVLMSPFAWGKGKTLAAAKRALLKAGGDTEEILVAYVTADTGAYVDGLGCLTYSTKKPTFKIPVGRRHSDHHAIAAKLICD